MDNPSNPSVSMRNRKQLGGRAAPFGYRWQDDVLVPHPEEAPVRKRMYELFVEHRNQQTVARLLNKMGYSTRRGVRADGKCRSFPEAPRTTAGDAETGLPSETWMPLSTNTS